MRPDKRVKTDIIVIRVTPEEKQEVQRQAALICGGDPNASAYLLHLHRAHASQQRQYEFMIDGARTF